MNRFLIPATLLVMISGLAFVLIAIVIARSPYTHGNLRPQGYNRTEIVYVGEDQPFEGLGLADPQLAATGDPAQDGRVMFFGYGCASCHGLKGQGGAVGPELDIGDISLSEFRRKIRKGPKGMPSFMEQVLSDEDIGKLYTFLKSVSGGAPEKAALASP